MSTRKVTTKSETMSTLDLKNKLLKWICERHATNEPLDRKLLREKAMELTTSLGVIGFKCSETWLTLFLKKHGFSPSLTSCDGPTFPNYTAWIDLLRSLLTQYRHKDLFNVDELVMYPTFFPTRKLVEIPFKRHSDNVLPENLRGALQTRKIVILLCCNSSGTEKLEPLISDFPVDGSDEKKRENRYQLGTSDENFRAWLEKLNNRMLESQRSVLLLLSRGKIRSLHDLQRFGDTQHPSNVKLVFLPRDFPPHLRPLRGDVFHSVKMTYRKRYADFVRRREKTGCNSDWGKREIVAGITEAWKNVPQELVVSNFQRTKFREDESTLRIQYPEWESFGTGMSFRKFVTFDDELCDETCDIRVNPELRSSPINNKHRYNLRRTRLPTIELDDPVMAENSVRIENRQNRKSNEPVDRPEIPMEQVPFEGPSKSLEIQKIEESFPRNRETLELTISDKSLTPRMNEVQNLPDAGPSRILVHEKPETLGIADPRDFQDEEKLPDDAELKLQIENAIEICDSATDHETSKRPRTADSAITDDTERARKVTRSDSYWTKRYETNFVFGSEIGGNEESGDASNRGETGNDEIEKRCIFTLEGSSELSTASYSKKD